MKETLNCLFEPLERLESFQTLNEAIGAGKICSVYGPDDAQRAHLLAALARKTGRRLIVLAPNDMLAMHMTEDLNVLLEGGARLLPGRDISFVKSSAASRDLAMRRIDVIGACVTGAVQALVVPVDAALHRMLPPQRFKDHVVALDESARMEPNDLMQLLTDAGYERVQLVEARGQCALRGGILDVYPIGEPNALRIEFFDDEIDSIRSFDVMTQRSISRRESARIYPAKEFLLTQDEARRAAQFLRFELKKRSENPAQANRQKKLETEFGLTPFEEFLKASQTEEKEEGADAERATIASSRDRSFLQVIDALETGRSFDGAESILPVLLNAGSTILEYFDDPLIVFDQPERLRERSENRFLEFKELLTAALERGDALPVQAELLLSYDQLLSRVDGRGILITNPFLRTERDFRPQALIQIESRNATGYQANIKELALDLEKWRKEGWQVALLAGGVARSERLQQALKNQDCAAEFLPEPPQTLPQGEVRILPLALNRGFLYPEIKFALVSESDIYGMNRQKSRSRARSGEKIAAFTDLKVGDYVVHENHGVGQFMGVVRLASEGTYRDFLHIRYQGTDKLYVPTDQLDRVQKYIGSEGEAPKLNRLSGGEWQRQKSKVRQSIKDIAGDLLKLYAQREAVPGYAFERDTPWQREFEDNFPYEETPDQLAAIEDIKRDMEKPKVMDRLLCGDVG